MAALGGLLPVLDPVFAQTWTQTSAPDLNWHAVASSADGTRLVAVVGGGFPGPIFVSTNSGDTWTPTSAPVQNWFAVASSANGTRLVATATSSPPYTSADSGATWTSNNVPDAFAVASSADGSKLVAVLNGGGIYVSQSTPAPLLNIRPSSGEALISWIVPSMDFVLQQNSDLTTTNWTDVTNTPTLNLTSLQNEVVVSATNGVRFYRLKH